MMFQKIKALYQRHIVLLDHMELAEDISNDGIDNDNDGKIDENDNDEFGEPRIYASNVAAAKIAEDIANDIMSTW